MSWCSIYKDSAVIRTKFLQSYLKSLRSETQSFTHFFSKKKRKEKKNKERVEKVNTRHIKRL